MRKFIILVLFASFALSADKESTFSVQGMMCGAGCVKKIERNIGSLDGIIECDVDFDNGSMFVKYDDRKLSDDKIISTLNDKTTYKCSIKEKDSRSPFKRWLDSVFG